MEGENLYNLSRERRELRKAARDTELPETVSRAAAEGIQEIKVGVSGMIAREGGLSQAKKRYTEDKAAAEGTVLRGGLDVDGAARAMGEEAEPFRQALSLSDKLDDLRDFEMRRALEKKNDPHATRAHERLLNTARQERSVLEGKISAIQKNSPCAFRAAELVEYKEGLAREGHIVPVPSVRENLKRIGRNILLGKPMFLHGPTGTGKTSQARFAAEHFTGKRAEMVYCNPQTREANVWGKTGIRPAKEGYGAMETVDIYGPLAKAMQEGKAVIFDEFNALPLEQMVFLKGVFNATVGDTVTVVGNGKVKIMPGFQMLFTANLKSEKNPERQALPPEIAREFEQNNLKISYLGKDEAFDVMLARLMNPDGSLDLSWHDLRETLPKLCEAMEETQVAYTGEMRADTARLLEVAGAAGRARGLVKLVMTQGTVEAILEDWKAEKEHGGTLSFAAHIDRRLKIGLTFEEYPLADRLLAAKIFAAKGFLRTLTPEELGLPADVFAFDAAKRLRGDEKARADMLKGLSAKSGNEKHITLKELADLDPFGVRAKERAARLAALRGMLPPEGSRRGPETAGEGETTFDRAEEIMGTRLLGPAEVEQVFGVAVEKIPPIPFPENMLEKLKDSCRLILYADKFTDGTPVTALAIADKFGNKKADGTKLLSSLEASDWKRSEDFFTKETPALRWRLVSDEVIPDSVSKNYLEQTNLLADYVESRYDDKRAIPSDIREMIDEARALAGDADFQAKVVSEDVADWKQAAERLSQLPLNQKFRESFVELFYRFVLVDRARAEQLLKVIHSWTNSPTSGGNLACGGFFGADGAEVYRWRPSNSYSGVGCAFSAEKL